MPCGLVLRQLILFLMSTKVLIIGSGVSGLYLAYLLPRAQQHKTAMTFGHATINACAVDDFVFA